MWRKNFADQPHTMEPNKFPKIEETYMAVNQAYETAKDGEEFCDWIEAAIFELKQECLAQVPTEHRIRILDTYSEFAGLKSLSDGGEDTHQTLVDSIPCFYNFTGIIRNDHYEAEERGMHSAHVVKVEALPLADGYKEETAHAMPRKSTNLRAPPRPTLAELTSNTDAHCSATNFLHDMVQREKARQLANRLKDMMNGADGAAGPRAVTPGCHRQGSHSDHDTGLKCDGSKISHAHDGATAHRDSDSTADSSEA